MILLEKILNWKTSKILVNIICCCHRVGNHLWISSSPIPPIPSSTLVSPFPSPISFLSLFFNHKFSLICFILRYFIKFVRTPSLTNKEREFNVVKSKWITGLLICYLKDFTVNISVTQCVPCGGCTIGICTSCSSENGRVCMRVCNLTFKCQ